MSDEPNQSGLPNSITNPLRLAFLGLGLILAGFGAWAFYAPLASTIHTNGSLVSSRPSYDLQHAYGGRIAQVQVRTHDRVSQGQKLIQFDVAIQKDELQATLQQIRLLEDENSAVNWLLTGQHEALKQDQTIDETVRLRFLQKLRSHYVELTATAQDSDATERQITTLEQQLDLLQDRRASMQDRLAVKQKLARKGLSAQNEQSILTEQLLELDAEISTTNGQLAAKADDADKLNTSAQLVRARFRETLLEQKAQNAKRLPELMRAKLRLADEIDQALVLAPIDGIVTSLDFDTQEMFAGRGTTLMTLSRALADPKVSLVIPTHSIDQISVGRRGKLTIPSLPQRNLPPVFINLESISPDALRDADGNPVGYRALAEINSDDLAALIKSQDGGLSLSSDMPVSVGFEGRQLTFAQYMINPFFAVFDNALAD